MKFNRWLLAGIAGVQISLPAFAQDADTIEALKQQIQQLDQKVRILERKQELDKEVADAKTKDAPRVSLGQSGFTFSSADTNFAVKIKGVLQVDSRTFFNDNSASIGNDGFLLRRARPIIEGTVYRDLDFSFVPEFGGSGTPSIFDAWLNYRYRPELQLRIGKFKSPVGLEQLLSDKDLLFNERALVTDLVPNRDIGVQLWGDISGGVASYAFGIFNGVGDGRNTSNVDFDDNKEFAGRVFFQPFKNSNADALRGFGFGVGGSYSSISSNATGLPSGFVTDGQQQFFTYTNNTVANGEHWRISPHVLYTYGPFGLLGEYAISEQEVSRGALSAKLRNTAWQVSGQWVLTGEAASFTGIAPRRPFDLKAGGWGAWQLVARYGQLTIDDAAFQGFSNPNTSASGATAWSVGVNWWLNKNVRVLTSFTHTTFDGGGAFNPLDSSTLIPPATVTQQDENVFFTRLQLAF